MTYTGAAPQGILQGMEVSETRHISLPQGGTLEVTMTDRFQTAVRQQFELSENELVTDDHIRMFIFGALKNALDKEEAQ